MKTAIKLSIWAVFACGILVLGPVASGGQSDKPVPEQRNATQKTAITQAAALKIAWLPRRDPSNAVAGPVFEQALRGISITSGSSIDHTICILLKIDGPNKDFSNEFEIFVPLKSLGGEFDQTRLTFAVVMGMAPQWPNGAYHLAITFHTTTDNGTKRGDCISNTLTDTINIIISQSGNRAPFKKMVVEAGALNVSR
jgi:hypothetical protein